MESGKIRDAQDEMSAHAERANDLVQDPKDLFGVLQDLIGNHEVDRFITESQAVPFDVELNDLNPTPLETLPYGSYPPRRTASDAGSPLAQTLGQCLGPPQDRRPCRRAMPSRRNLRCGPGHN